MFALRANPAAGLQDEQPLVVEHCSLDRRSPVGPVGLVLRAVNEVKLEWARLVLGWVTRLTVSIGLWLWADQLRP